MICLTLHSRSLTRIGRERRVPESQSAPVSCCPIVSFPRFMCTFPPFPSPSQTPVQSWKAQRAQQIQFNFCGAAFNSTAVQPGLHCWGLDRIHYISREEMSQQAKEEVQLKLSRTRAHTVTWLYLPKNRL